MLEQWNSTNQTQGTAGNREAGGFVNMAVTMKLVKDYPLWKFRVQIKSSAPSLSIILTYFTVAVRCHTLDKS